MIRHPVAGPLVFGFSTLTTSLIAYFFAFILTNDWRSSAWWAIIADIVIVAYLMVCYGTAKRGKGE